MTDVFKQTQHAYDQIVLDFAKRNHVPLTGNLLAMAEKMVQRVGRNGHILDIGCGTGRDMVFFESHGLIVTGLDLSAGMLAYARREIHGGLALMNMCRIGFPQACFDGAWSSASLLHIPKPLAPGVLQEMRRVLKPLGTLILTIQEGNFEGWEESPYAPGGSRFFARYQTDEMKGMLTNNGFSILKAGAAHEHNRDWLSFMCVSG